MARNRLSLALARKSEGARRGAAALLRHTPLFICGASNTTTLLFPDQSIGKGKQKQADQGPGKSRGFLARETFSSGAVSGILKSRTAGAAV